MGQIQIPPQLLQSIDISSDMGDKKVSATAQNPSS
jgi:hypothetical protein